MRIYSGDNIKIDTLNMRNSIQVTHIITPNPVEELDTLKFNAYMTTGISFKINKEDNQILLYDNSITFTIKEGEVYRAKFFINEIIPRLNEATKRFRNILIENATSVSYIC